MKYHKYVKTGSGEWWLLQIFSWSFVALLLLKLCNKIDWSWWWVIAPLWPYFGLIFFVSTVIAHCEIHHRDRTRRNRYE